MQPYRRKNRERERQTTYWKKREISKKEKKKGRQGGNNEVPKYAVELSKFDRIKYRTNFLTRKHFFK